ncbi:MAG: GntR family transcriptional regulator [Pseudomonadota bacterium]
MNLQSMRRQDVPLHAEVAAVLRHQITSGELPSGAKLPALRELTDKLGVARMTIIQAMNSLEDEGLIERQSGRGTFVRSVPIPNKVTLQMRADISQIYAMVSQLEVAVENNQAGPETKEIDGRSFRLMRRTHLKDGSPFCHVELRLDSSVFDRAPSRFETEIAVSVLEDLGVEVESARQKITVSYADFELARALEITVNAAVFRVVREFYDANGSLVYSALLMYPADLMELEIEFSIGPPAA